MGSPYSLNNLKHKLKDVPSTWQHHRSERQGEIHISQYCPVRPYIEVRVPEHTAVRRVIFKTVSHDQGFSDQGGQGTYEGSFTFFDARVITPTGQERVAGSFLQKNVHANADFREHMNVWDYEESDEYVRTEMGKIRGGDVVGIVPKAQYFSWVNYVKEARIDLYVEPVHAPMSLIAEVNDSAIYQRLHSDKKEIRVILLESGTGDDDVYFTLQSISLLDDDFPKYEALSYCWGETDNKQTTLLRQLDDSIIPFLVTENLLAALKRFRRRDGESRLLWIDFICINQRDPKERGDQVGFMGDIYAAAETVLIWLGEINEMQKEEFNVFNNIADHYTDKEELVTAKASHGSIYIPSINWYAMWHSRVFTREWFRRIWVLQEAWRAKKALVHCGDSVVSFETIAQANYCFKKRSDGYTIPSMPSIWLVLFQLVRDRSPLQVNPTPGLKILDTVLAGLDLQATDARDKIFALLGFCEETCDVSRLPFEIRPNYNKSEVQVYTDFTRWWIKENASLRILSAVHTVTGRTWVDLSSAGGSPNPELELSRRPSWSLWHEGRSEWIHGTLALDDSSTFNATANKEVDVALMEQSESRTTLALRGYMFAKIIAISPYPFYDPDFNTESLRNAYKRLFDPTGSISTWGAFPNHVAKHVDRDHHPADKLRNHYTCHWHSHPQWMRDPLHLPCHNDCLFMADDGIAGLCPSGARVGDLVVVLYGGKVPYLLRAKARDKNQTNSGVEYYFVGECYRDDLMDGQRVSSIREGIDDEVFTLV